MPFSTKFIMPYLPFSTIFSSIKMRFLRAFFIFHIQIIDDCVFFKYLVPRGEAYDKKYKEKLYCHSSIRRGCKPFNNNEGFAPEHIY